MEEEKPSDSSGNAGSEVQNKVKVNPRVVFLIILSIVFLALVVWVRIFGNETVRISGVLPTASDSFVAGSSEFRVQQGVAFLVPGYGGGAGCSYRDLVEVLSRAGWNTQVLDIGTGQGDLKVYSRQLSEMVNRVGSKKVPIALVGYDEGGLIVRDALSFDEKLAERTSRVVTIASPHDGNDYTGKGVVENVQNYKGKVEDYCPLACQQMLPKSSFLGGLKSISESNGRVLNVYASSGGGVILPAESAVWRSSSVKNVDIEKECKVKLDHGNMVHDTNILNLVSQFLMNGTVPSSC